MSILVLSFEKTGKHDSLIGFHYIVTFPGTRKMVARLGGSVVWSFGGQAGAPFGAPEYCYCNPGWCWQDGTSFCLVCGDGEYQDSSEATTGVLNKCTSVAPTTVIGYPYNAPVGACKKIDRGMPPSHDCLSRFVRCPFPQVAMVAVNPHQAARMKFQQVVRITRTSTRALP